MVTIGLVGYGYWGPNLARNIVEVPGCRLGGVCDARPERLALAERRFPGVRTTTNAQDLLADPAIDAIAIATPVSTHFVLAMEALQSGKHVLVEKPLTLSVAEAEQLVEEAERRRRILMVDHTFVYTGAVRKIRELALSGELGQVYYYDSVRINLGLFQHDANVLWDLAVHDLSILDYVLGGEAKGISAIGVRHVREQLENIAYLTLVFPNNLMAHLHVNWLAPVKIRRTVIGGSRKMVVYDDLEPSEKVKIYDRGVDVRDDEAALHKMLVSYRAGEMRAPQIDVSEALQVELTHFVDCIRKGTTPVTDGRAGLRIVRLLEAASQSMRQDGRMVEVGAERAALPI